MPFVHEVAFDIPVDRAIDLKIGKGLQRVIGFLRSLLPNEPGFVSARAMHSVGQSNVVHVVIQSVWEYWDDLIAHNASRMAAEKVLAEFGGVVPTGGLTVRTYEEIS